MDILTKPTLLTRKDLTVVEILNEKAKATSPEQAVDYVEYTDTLLANQIEQIKQAKKELSLLEADLKSEQERIKIGAAEWLEDLGVDVPAEKFIESIKQSNVEILGLSALLTIAIDSVEEIVALIEKENLRDKIKIIVGGSAFNEEVAEKLGVDAYGKDPMEALKICQNFLG